MGVNVFPAPTASSGLVANRPRFALSNTYTLTHSAGVRSYHMDCTYQPSTNSVIVVTGSGEGSQIARWVVGSGSFVTSNLPNAIWNDTSITVGFDNAIYTARSNNTMGSPVYRSTDNGVNWSGWGTNYANYSNVVPLSNKISSNGNSTDVVAAGVGINGGADFLTWDVTASAVIPHSMVIYANAGNWSNLNNPSRHSMIAPIRKGDDDFAISGYLTRCGQTVQNAYAGSHGHLSNPIYDDYRGGGSISIFDNQMNTNGTVGINGTYRTMVAGRWTAIENRWMILTGPWGMQLFDLQSNNFVGSPAGISVSAGSGYIGRPVYISSTKKLYVPASTASNTIKMHEFDVTFE